MSDETAAFAANLHRLRKERGWSQQHLADEAGTNGATISSIERETHRPGLHVACALAKALGTTVDAMTGEAGERRD